MSSLSLHWIFYAYGMTHMLCYIATIKLAKSKNLLTNRFYVFAVLLSPIAFISTIISKPAPDGSNQPISIYNFALLAIVIVVFTFSMRILPDIIAD